MSNQAKQCWILHHFRPGNDEEDPVHPVNPVRFPSPHDVIPVQLMASNYTLDEPVLHTFPGRVRD